MPMADKRHKKAPAYGLWLEFEHVQPPPGDDPEFDFFNMKVSLESGETYALNVWTFKYLERVTESLRTGKVDPGLALVCDFDPQNPLERQYLTPPDLLVTRRDRKLIEEIISHLLIKWRGRLSSEWETSSK